MWNVVPHGWFVQLSLERNAPDVHDIDGEVLFAEATIRAVHELARARRPPG